MGERQMLPVHTKRMSIRASLPGRCVASGAVLDPRTPVVVGVAQAVRRPSPDDVSEASEPADMMADVLRAAAADSGAGAVVLERADSVRTVDLLSWPYANPAAAVAERIGASPRETVHTTLGGNSPQLLVNDAAAAVQRGELDVVLVAGAEAVYTRLLARRATARLDWSVQPEGSVAPPQLLGSAMPGNNDLEMDAGIVLPTQVYPMMENALRAAAGESIDDHQRRVSELWARFSAVAAGNPYAWSPVERSPDEIRTVTADNRMVSFPYPKLMNSNIQTDQAAALIVCSVAAAERFGVPRDRWVFPVAGADAHDTWFMSDRESFTRAPALGAAFRSLGVSADDIAHVDLYSCFPSAVQVAAAELGFSPERQLTVTGGLGFAGGPGSNYVTHAIAAMVDVLRRDPGSVGLATGVGWYLTKHSLGLYSTEPPVGGFRHTARPDPAPARAAVAGYRGAATIEAYTIQYDRDGAPDFALFSLLTPDGRRTWHRSGPVDPTEEWCGRVLSL